MGAPTTAVGTRHRRLQKGLLLMRLRGSAWAACRRRGWCCRTPRAAQPTTVSCEVRPKPCVPLAAPAALLQP